jgi:hypothetical protein
MNIRQTLERLMPLFNWVFLTSYLLAAVLLISFGQVALGVALTVVVGMYAALAYITKRTELDRAEREVLYSMLARVTNQGSFR